jgi:murein DD-endopeptidase MepM/ murein hydrolase activator NlpD
MWLKIWDSKWFQWMVSVTLSVIVLFLVMHTVKADINRINTKTDKMDATDDKILKVLSVMVTSDSIRDINYKHLPVVLPIPSMRMTKVTSIYGNRIINNDTSFHVGTDFSALMGTPVIASAAGQVVFAKYDDGYGNCIRIDSNNGVVSTYAHLKEIRVTLGQQIEQGDLIGSVGSTGNSTGPHLHFEVQVYGKNVDTRIFKQL